MSFTSQSFIVLLAIGIVMFFKSLFLALVVPALGILVAFYLIISKRKRNEILNFFILISLVLILIVSTGEMSSPFFFLIYFLSFAIAFVFDPRTVFVFTAGLIVLFFPSALRDNLNQNLIMLFSLFLLSPVAFFLGKDYQEKQEKKRIIKQMEHKALEIEDEIKEVLHDTKQKLNPKAAIKLSEALIAAEELEEISDKK